MAVIKTDGGYNALPISYKRGNPIPLDTTAVWYDYDAMKAYAETGATAYVGQILGLVDEVKETATAYIIINTSGALQEVGAAVVVDNTTISFNLDGQLSLKDFNKQYYKYIAESTNEETGETIEAHYEIQVVDETHPWIAGLEPKVVSENGKLVIGWYEPNPTTIEGVNDQVTAVQTTVNDLKQVVNDLQAELGDPAKEGSSASGLYAELDKKADADKVYTKEETDAAIAAASHLKRKICEDIEEADLYIATKDDADQYIFMVPDKDETDDDVYDEYLAILLSDPETGEEVYTLEKVGSWKVDLSDYAKTADVEEALKKKVDAKENERLITKEEADKLASIDADAANLIKNINDNEFTIDNAGVLNLKAIEATKVTGLSEALNGVFVPVESGKGLSSNDFTDALKTKLETLDLQTIADLQTGLGEVTSGLSSANTEISGLKTTTSNLTTELGQLTTAVNELGNTYVSIENFNTVVGDLETLLQDNYNVKLKLDGAITDIDALYEMLEWTDMIEPTTT
jgi:hypothetical protein